jgi:hypothetical protein
MSKKIALILFGYSYYEGIPIIYFENGQLINYKNSLDNYKKYIFQYFKSLGYDIDVFISSYNSIKEKELLEDYNPVAYKLNKPITNWQSQIKRMCCNERIIEGLSLCATHSENNNIRYDNILITRFDLYFMIDFNKVNFKFDEFQIVSFLDNNENKGMDDNFYFFPFKYLNIFNNILKENSSNNNRHYYYKLITKYIDIACIYNENKPVGGLNFFKIVRQDNNTKKLYLQYPGKLIAFEDIIKK